MSSTNVSVKKAMVWMGHGSPSARGAAIPDLNLRHRCRVSPQDLGSPKRRKFIMRGALLQSGHT